MVLYVVQSNYTSTHTLLSEIQSTPLKLLSYSIAAFVNVFPKWENHKSIFSQLSQNTKHHIKPV